MKIRRDTAFLLLLPILLVASAGLVFAVGAHGLGKETGYLLGFAFYWLVWCVAIPRAFLGKQGFATLLTDQQPLWSRTNAPAALLWAVVTIVSIFMYGGDFVRAPLLLLVVAIPLATVNGLCEEILWRGLYVRAFPANPWMAVVYPAFGFALWHFAPQTVFLSANVAGFALSTSFLGLAYGFIAYRTGSAKWTAVSHSLSGILALSGMLAPSVLTLLTR